MLCLTDFTEVLLHIGCGDSRLEGPGFESRCRQVGGRNLENFVHPISPANPHWLTWKGRPTTPACKALQSNGPQRHWKIPWPRRRLWSIRITCI